MFRIKLLLVLLAIPAIADAQSRYLLRGEITDGSSLFPPDEFDPSLTWENYGDPPEGYPIDYTARLNVGPGDDWSFHFTAMAMELEDTHSIAPPVRPSLEVGPETFIINHVGGRVFVEWFNMDLNLEAGVGNWSWEQDCPVCDLLYPLPSALATVTSIDIAIGDFDNNSLWNIDDINALMARIANGSKAGHGPTILWLSIAVGCHLPDRRIRKQQTTGNSITPLAGSGTVAAIASVCCQWRPS